MSYQNPNDIPVSNQGQQNPNQQRQGSDQGQLDQYQQQVPPGYQDPYGYYALPGSDFGQQNHLEQQDYYGQQNVQQGHSGQPFYQQQPLPPQQPQTQVSTTHIRDFADVHEELRRLGALERRTYRQYGNREFQQAAESHQNDPEFMSALVIEAVRDTRIATDKWQACEKKIATALAGLKEMDPDEELEVIRILEEDVESVV